MSSQALHGLTLGALVSSVVCAACASAGGSPRPFPTPVDRRTAGELSAPVHQSIVDTDALVGTALNLRGTPYKPGGADLTGFDCSGFTHYVFAQYGLSLPRAVQEQFGTGRPVAREGVAPGDLLFFATATAGASHVGIALGGDAFVHAPSSRGVVRVERFSSSYWRQRLVGVRRVVNEN